MSPIHSENNFFTGSPDFENVIVVSPCGGGGEDIDGCNQYTYLAMLDCKQRGEGGLSRQMLMSPVPWGDDESGNSTTFSAGNLWCALTVLRGWAKAASKAVFYLDRGVSQDMIETYRFFQSERPDLKIEFRTWNKSQGELRMICGTARDTGSRIPLATVVVQTPHEFL